jgi:hypothetical protein
VLVKAVKTEFVLSSARATAGRLTSPAPIKVKVHALYFMIFSLLASHTQCSRVIGSAPTHGIFRRHYATVMPSEGLECKWLEKGHLQRQESYWRGDFSVDS